MRFQDEEGQSIILVALAMSIFLLGAVGLGFDGSHLYSQRQMAQTAADAAAQAGMMSIFDGTNTVSTNAAKFTATAGSSFSCATYPSSSPCAYASKNGFSSANGDTVSVSFPTSAPGVALSSTDPVNLVQVTVSRSVKTTLMRLLGPTATTVIATATAAIVTVINPTPILVTHPHLSGALSMVGSKALIKICGGPSRSIEINSNMSDAFSPGTSGVDLSHAGPKDPGDCSAGTGADFGVFGGPTSNPNPLKAVNLGVGNYISPASPIQDPFINVTPPSVPAAAPAPKAIANGTDGCVQSGGCTEYSPGLYNSNAGLDLTKATVIFKPGVYYVQSKGGVTVKQTTGGGTNYSSMCVGCTADANTGNGILIYDTGPSGSALNSNPSGGFQVTTQNNISFQGPTLTVVNSNGKTVPTTPYYDLTFWEDRTADANSHSMGQGNGCFQVIGTIYITNTNAVMAASPYTHYQSVSYGGTPCSTTIMQGDIVVSALSLNGNGSITMNLVPYGFLNVRQVALVQ